MEQHWINHKLLSMSITHLLNDGLGFVFQIPSEHIRAYPWKPGAIMFYTGDNADVASSIASNMLPPFAPPSTIPTPSNNKFLQMAENQVSCLGEYLSGTI